MFSRSSLLVCLVLVSSIQGHGRLRHPPARSTMWRDNWPTVKNFDDNSLFCGGFDLQWNTNGGKCGLCGDAYNGKREHEWGGKYMQGIAVEHYRVGQEIMVGVEITANHRGWFEFKLCEFDTELNPATQACLDNHVLALASGQGTKFQVNTWRSGMWNVSLTLPSNVLCDKCMLQWRYHAGNSYNTGSDGISCLGCGPQEEFYGCADVRISQNGGTISKPEPATTTSSPVASTTTAHPIYCSDGLFISSVIYNSVAMDNWCMTVCSIPTNMCPSSHCRCKTPLVPGETTPTTTTTTTTTTQAPDTGLVCSDGLYEPTLVYQAASNMYAWCQSMCTSGTCYRSHCQCVNPSAEV